MGFRDTGAVCNGATMIYRIVPMDPAVPPVVPEFDSCERAIEYGDSLSIAGGYMVVAYEDENDLGPPKIVAKRPGPTAPKEPDRGSQP